MPHKKDARLIRVNMRSEGTGETGRMRNLALPIQSVLKACAPVYMVFFSINRNKNNAASHRICVKGL